jgi:hypothetical protein
MLREGKHWQIVYPGKSLESYIRRVGTLLLFQGSGWAS